MTNLFFSDTLQKSPSRIAPTTTASSLLLDKNEQSDDVDFSIKEKVLNSLLNANWNRYPSADCSDIEALVANYCDLDPANIVLGPGSASIITTMLNYFALNGKRIVIAQPSYTLFDYHCKTYNIPYESWMLTPELEYDYENIPALGAGSVLIITTPNNPVGNTIEQAKLEHILRSNPESFVILDAVYAEFAEMDLAPLVRKYDNLMVLRSFSKAFPMAGLRFGYLCAAPQVATVIRKLMLQFSINHLTQVFAREVLFTPEFLEDSRQRVCAMMAERDRMFRLLNRRFEASALKVSRSSGNFLLVRVFDDATFGKLMSDLEKNGIKVLNTSPFPLLRNTFRVSIGAILENEIFIRSLTESLRDKCIPRYPRIIQIGGYHKMEKVRPFSMVANL